MRYISHRTGILELRRTSNIATEEPYLEIVKWYQVEGEEEYCCTIAIFEDDGEGYDLKSVGDRILLDEFEWIDLRTLIKIGFEVLEKSAQKGDNE